jgi:protein-export membrane protein SecD
MNSLRDVIERRVNIFGVSEPLVQVEKSGIGSATKEERLIVELPGVTDLKAAVAAIGVTPTLTFRLLRQDVPPSALSSTSSLAEINGDPFLDTGLTGGLLSRSQLTFNQTTGEPEVSVKFNKEGEDLFAKITREHTGQYLGIFLDGALVSIPVIRQEITGGEAQITGGFSLDEAKGLVRNLNLGALPVPIELISSQTIGASLGDSAVKAGVFAGIWGFAFVALFLIIWYRLPGFVSVLALSLYVVLMLVAFKLIPVVLTAAGIAAFILSIGMAVDANILIFERMKEELHAGKKLGDAMHEGFARAWPSIRDSNTSSMITAVILYWLGTSAVIKGFALVFFVGVLASMFTAITASRIFLYTLGFNLERRGGIINFLFGSGLSK